MATYGKLKEFEPDNEKVSSYLERVELYFTANDIAAEKKVVILLSVIIAKTYSLLRDLLAPTNPKEKSFETLVEVLERYFEPKPLVIAERFTFLHRNQLPNELILEYVAELRRIAVHCEFAAYPEKALRDRLVCGLSIQKRLLTEAGLTFTRAVELAQGMEVANQNTQLMKGRPKGRVSHDQKSTGNSGKQEQCKRKKPCYHCGKAEHAPSDCTFKNSNCHTCGRKDHIAKVCHSKKVNLADRVETEQSPSAHTDDFIFRVENRSSESYQVAIQINGKPVIMEIDTEAAVSIMSSQSYKSLFPKTTLQKPTIKL